MRGTCSSARNTGVCLYCSTSATLLVTIAWVFSKKQEKVALLGTISNLTFQMVIRWWSKETVAVVTGANQGIGYEIARQLAVHGLHVVLTSRDFDRALGATTNLQAEGLSVQPCQLDITDAGSVMSFASWIQLEHGGIDVLVNNAGVNFNGGADNSVEFAETVIKTNYYGTKRIIDTMLPMMRPSSFGARIVNVSSRLGRANGRKNKIGDPTLRENLMKDETLSEELLDEMLTNFLSQVNDGTWQNGGWPQMYTDYSLSKLALNVYTRLKARRLSERLDSHRVYINCFCPGWVKTQMTNWEGNMSAEEGADTGVWMALLPVENISSGRFYAERREIDF
ncbi:NAD(P)-binding Rossmann-fold superfamily protein [Rhynchospora pubera]|uniref:Short-chain dehydrogenase/reductase n=1 Tax=Rhynchospora pubera TaxID=906938 RepID=A0AAV8CU70_9POAL|nr:NAD(P)-binding Rossmann-fold superfamily protein [Rhynchospora pubera]